MIRIVLATVWCRFGSWGLVWSQCSVQTLITRFGQDFEVEIQARIWRWSLVSILLEKVLIHHFKAETQGFQGLVDQNDRGKYLLRKQQTRAWRKLKWRFLPSPKGCQLLPPCVGVGYPLWWGYWWWWYWCCAGWSILMVWGEGSDMGISQETALYQSW